MTLEKTEAAPGQEPPPDAQQALQLAEPQQQPTATIPAALRRRREAAWRIAPAGDGNHDPLDALADASAEPVEWGTYDVTTLGLDCIHGEGCPVRRAEAI